MQCNNTLDFYTKKINLHPFLTLRVENDLSILSIRGDSSIFSTRYTDINIKNNKLVLSNCASPESCDFYNSLLNTISLLRNSSLKEKTLTLKLKGSYLNHMQVKVIKSNSQALLIWYYINHSVEEFIQYMNHDVSKDRLYDFANMSHELRTPINVILGITQLAKLYLKKESFNINNDKIQEYVSLAKINSLRLLKLVNHILDLIRSDASNRAYKNQVLNIVPFIEDITTSIFPYIKNKDIDIIFDTDSEEVFCNIDPYLIEKVILNLLSNGIKFTPSGGNIYIKISREESKVLISIKDTGVGIEPDKLNNIFERFSQTGSSSSKNQGTGIGLSLAYTIIKKHGGDITVTSEPQKGSNFTVILPIHEGPLDNSHSNAYFVEAARLEFSDTYISK